MRLGRPKVALSLTDDERVQLTSMAPSVADGPAPGAPRAHRLGMR